MISYTIRFMWRDDGDDAGTTEPFPFEGERTVLGADTLPRVGEYITFDEGHHYEVAEIIHNVWLDETAEGSVGDSKGTTPCLPEVALQRVKSETSHVEETDE